MKPIPSLHDASLRSIPAKGIAAGKRRLSKVLVDGHRKIHDPMGLQQIGKRPRHAVDVTHHRRPDRQPEPTPELVNFSEHKFPGPRRGTLGHHSVTASDFNQPAFFQIEKSFHLAVFRGFQPVKNRDQRLAGPLRPGTLGIVGGSFRQSHRLIKKPLLQIAHHRLRVRVSNVGMAVVNEINRFEHKVSFSFYRHGLVQAKDTEEEQNCRVATRNALVN